MKIGRRLVARCSRDRMARLASAACFVVLLSIRKRDPLNFSPFAFKTLVCVVSFGQF